MCECCKKSYIIFSLTPFFIVCIALNFLTILKSPYCDGKFDFDDLKANWEMSPIISISFDQSYFYNLNEKINKNNLKNLHKALTVKRLNKKYNYKYLLREDINEPGIHPCGKDGAGNYLFLPKNIECPINEYKISSNSNPDIDKNEETRYYHYETTKIYNGIYLHYSNENINGTILTDIDFELQSLDEINDLYELYEYMYYPDIYGYNYEPYRKINFTSNEIIEKGYTLYLIMKNYMGFIFNPNKDGKRDLTDFKVIYNYNIRLYLNIISLILLFISLITLFIDNIREGEPAIFQILTTIFLYIQVVIQIIIFIYYGRKDQVDKIIERYYDFCNQDEDYYIYDDINLGFIVTITALYISLTNHRENDNNYYYYLVYYFRYSFFNNCCFCCKEIVAKNREKNERIIRELKDDISQLKSEKNEYNRKIKGLESKNKKILKEIVNKSNILNNMKDEENSFWNINEEEEIKFEIKFQQLMKDNEPNIKKYENIKNEIQKIEKEINYYKMIEFKQELNNQ